MLSQFGNLDFWFIRPSTFLTAQDKLLFYIFIAFIGLAVLAVIGRVLARNKVTTKLARKFFHLFLTVGLLGIIWYGFRYENTDVLGLRYWAALILLTTLIWLGFVLKYLIMNFSGELKEYQHEMVKNKYLAGSKSR